VANDGATAAAIVPAADAAAPRAQQDAAIVDATLRTARRTVAVALLTMAGVVALMVAERAWLLGTHQAAVERVAQAERLSGALLLADERLTMSTYMAAASGEERWIARYHQHLPEVEAALAAGRALAPTDVARRFTEQTRATTERLTEFETSALEAIAVRAPDVARAILDSDRYRQAKSQLTASTIEFSDSTRTVLRSELANLGRREGILLGSSLLLSLLLAWVTWRRLSASLARSRHALLQAQADVRRMASLDLLTGWPNRTALHEGLPAALGTAQAGGAGLALLMIDLDGFKPVNDRHGHQAGDRVLRIAAQRMGNTLRSGELHARYGGDEFVILVDAGVDSAAPQRLAERLIDCLSEPIEFGGLVLRLSASVGFARFPDDAAHGDELLKRADLALYRAKHGGRARVCRYDAAIDNARDQRQLLEQRLRSAIEAGQIVPHYQPVVDLPERRVRSVELLSRWQDPQRGLVPPSEFIELAERSGLIGELTRSVLRQACADLRRMPAHWRVAVNIAPDQIQHPRLVADLMRVLRATDTDPRRIEVELTETALVGDIAAARRTIDALKREGITVALDDFGTGYSSLSTLSQLSFDKIKIDRAFVATLHERSESVKIVQSILGLGASLGVQVVAEGVETERDARALEQLGCSAAQGYLFARPLPIDALLQAQPLPVLAVA
jgi:diguanylate cyclase (GGDEF)-like protein